MMHLKGNARWLGRNRLLIGVLIALVVGLGGATGYAVATQRPHATAQVFVSISSATSTRDLSTGSTYAHDIAESYARVATTPIVLEPVIRELGLRLTSTQLAEQVSATVPDGTVLVDVTVSDSSGTRAAQIANAIARRLATVADTLAPKSTNKGPTVTLIQVQAARPAP